MYKNYGVKFSLTLFTRTIYLLYLEFRNSNRITLNYASSHYQILLMSNIFTVVCFAFKIKREM